MTHLRGALLLVLLMVVCPWGETRGAERSDAAVRAKVVAPYVGEQLLAVLRVDLTKIDIPAVFQQGFDMFRVSAPQQAGLVKLSQTIEQWKQSLIRAGAHELYFIVDPGDILHFEPFVIVPVAKRGRPKVVASLMFSGRADGPTSLLSGVTLLGREPARLMRFDSCSVNGSTVSCASGKTFQKVFSRQIRWLKGERTNKQPSAQQRALIPAFRAVDKSAIQLLILPSADASRVVRKMLPDLPGETGNGPIVADGLLWAAVGIDLSPRPAVRVVIQSKNAQAARRFQKYLMDGMQVLANVSKVRRAIPRFDELVSLLTPTIKGDQLVLTTNEQNKKGPQLLSILQPAVGRLLGSDSRIRCRNKLKKIGLAMHDFHFRYSSLPPAAGYDRKGRKLLSWRVYLLPFLGQSRLYQQFHLDEPWDSPHNKTLIAKMPGVFACPSIVFDKPGMTTYLVPTGKQTVFPGKAGVPMRQITDGTSNTILVIDVDRKHAVIWTKPDDLPVDPKQPQRGVGTQHEGGFWVLFCDGSTHFLSKTITPKTLYGLFTRNGGEIVNGKF